MCVLAFSDDLEYWMIDEVEKYFNFTLSKSMFSQTTCRLRSICMTILYHEIHLLYIYEIYLHNMELQVVRKEYNVIQKYIIV